MSRFEGLNEMSKVIYQNNKEKGFWDKERNIGELLMLVTSELAEALEAHRKGKNANLISFKSDLYFGDVIDFDIKESDVAFFQSIFKTHIKDTFEDEIADTLIRLLDLCGGLCIDIEYHVMAKVDYNKTREKLHGKKY